MRYGLISDVHANLPALTAVLDYLSNMGIDELLCAGDLIGYGGRPNECVRLLQEVGARCVAGNHELMVLGTLVPGSPAMLLQRSLTWTRSVLAKDVSAYLSSLPRVQEVDGIVATHGSLDDVQTYVRSRVQMEEELKKLHQRYPRSSMLMLGHTHKQAMHGRIMAGSLLRVVNPGSVGQSRQIERRPRARFMTLDVETGRISRFAIAYDHAKAISDARDSGLGRSSVSLRPLTPRVVVRALARRVRRW